MLFNNKLKFEQRKKKLNDILFYLTGKTLFLSRI